MSTDTPTPGGDAPGMAPTPGNDPVPMGIDAFNRFMQGAFAEAERIAAETALTNTPPHWEPEAIRDHVSADPADLGPDDWHDAAMFHATMACAMELRRANQLKEIELQIIDRNTPGPKLWTPGA